jgi:type IV pilus biogenesis protein CpaD/CtpE
MAIRPNQLVLVMLLGAALQGCSTTPRFNKHFGAAVRSNLSAQVINPAAAANADPATGVDGVAARAAHERYRRSFTETDPAASQSLVNGNGSR